MVHLSSDAYGIICSQEYMAHPTLGPIPTKITGRINTLSPHPTALQSRISNLESSELENGSNCKNVSDRCDQVSYTTLAYLNMPSPSDNRALDNRIFSFERVGIEQNDSLLSLVPVEIVPSTRGKRKRDDDNAPKTGEFLYVTHVWTNNPISNPLESPTQDNSQSLTKIDLLYQTRPEKKSKRGAPRVDTNNARCTHCGEAKTRYWRKGPGGRLCSNCKQFSDRRKKTQRDRNTDDHLSFTLKYTAWK